MSPIQPLAFAGADPAATTASQSGGSSDSATNAFGLEFDSLLKIILTQLTYQDPLKPMDNFEFVSQLAQFSQIQQGQTANDRLEALVTAQATLQATSLLGTQVDIPAGSTLLSGKVTAISFDNGSPLVTLQTEDGSTISGIALGSIRQIRQEN